MASQGKPMAWVTLATTDAYALGALVLAHSLRQAGTAHRLVIMITPGVTDTMRTQLSGAFDDVISVDVLDSGDAAHLALMARPELGVTLTKLHCWTLTQFSKCVFLDADCLVMTNCDELFEREELSAAPDIGWPDCFNSGVFVFTPSQETFSALVRLASETGSFDGGDQGLLNTYFSDWSTRDIRRHLPFLYNMTASATYTYRPAFLRFGQDVKIVHFLGSNKPWMSPHSADASSPSGRFHAAWWEIYESRVRRTDGGHSFLELPSGGAAAYSQVGWPAAPPPPPSYHQGGGADSPASAFRERAVEPLWAGDQRQSGGRRPTPLFDYTHTPSGSGHVAPPPPPPPPAPAPVHVWNPPPPPPPAPTPVWNPPPPPAPAPAPVWNPPPPPAPAPVWNPPPPPAPAPAPVWNPPPPPAPAPWHPPAWNPPAPSPARTPVHSPAPTPVRSQPQPKPWTPPGPPPEHRPWSAEPPRAEPPRAEPPRARSGQGTHRSSTAGTGAPASTKPTANLDQQKQTPGKPQQPATAAKLGTATSAGAKPHSGTRQPTGHTGHHAGHTAHHAGHTGHHVGHTGHHTAGSKVSGNKTGSRTVTGSRRIRTKSPGTAGTKSSGTTGSKVGATGSKVSGTTGSKVQGMRVSGTGTNTGAGFRPVGGRPPAPAGRATSGTRAASGAGAVANGSAAAAAAAADPESQEQRRRWEEGRIDFTGADRFDNVWRRISASLERRDQPAAAQQPSRAHSELVTGLAKMTVSSPAAPTPEDSARRAAWERGQMDYMGSDSFENILGKINQTLEK